MRKKNRQRMHSVHKMTTLLRRLIAVAWVIVSLVIVVGSAIHVIIGDYAYLAPMVIATVVLCISVVCMYGSAAQG